MTQKTHMPFAEYHARSVCLETNFKKKPSTAKRCLASFALCLLLCGFVFLTACTSSSTSESTQREQGKLPNIPLVMDQLLYWDEDKFADKMLLSDPYGGGFGTVAEDLANSKEGEGCEMLLLENYRNQNGNLVLDIAFATPIHEPQPFTRGERGLKETMYGLPNFNFGYEDAVDLLKKCGISKSSIKIYDDIYSKGLNIDQLANQQSGPQWGSEYEMCGEAETENGDALYFSVVACSMIVISGDVVMPFDSVDLRFSTARPFSLDPIFNKQSSSPIDNGVFDYLAEY